MEATGLDLVSGLAGASERHALFFGLSLLIEVHGNHLEQAGSHPSRGRY